MLWKLYHIEAEAKRANAELKSIQSSGGNQTEKVAELENVLKQEKKNHGQLLKSLLKLEKQLREKETSLNDLNPEILKIEEKIKYSAKKARVSQSNLDSFKENLKKQQNAIENLQSEKDKVAKAFATFEAQSEAKLKQSSHQILTGEAEKQYHEM